MTVAALGTILPLETLDGSEDVEIRPGTQPGHVVTLKARGVPHLRSAGRGDLMVHIDVQTPTKLDSRQEELLREFASQRGEEHVTGTFQRPEKEGLFTRLRDAFSSR